jgi:hypothetical protein
MSETPRGPLDFGDEPDAAESAPLRPLHPDQIPEPPRERRQGGPRWAVGVVVLIALVLIGVNAVTQQGNGPGAKGPAVGTRARAFTAPLAASALKGAPNIATKPDSGSAGKVPACQLHLRGAYNLCDAWKKGPVVVAMFITPRKECVDELHTLQDALARHPRVSAVAVAVRGNRKDAGKIAGGLRYPVVYDEDGRLASIYGVAVCPHITYLRRGGIVAGTNLGRASAERLEAQLRALETGARVVVR